MLWACILFPQLALDVVLRHQPDPLAPLALVSGPSQRRVLRAVNPSARALGLRPGQSLSAAHALSRDFHLVDYDLSQVSQAQQLLAAWGYRYSSQVSLHFPRALLLEVASGMGLFGPWPAFEARLRSELRAMGFAHRIVLATNPVAARMLANVHDGLAVTSPTQLQALLAQMPVDRIGLAKEQATALMRMGLRKVGQLLRLERAALARRFPAQLLMQLDLLQGLRPQAMEFFALPEGFDCRIELNFDVESTEALLFPLRRLISDLGVFLASRDGGVQRFVVHLEHAEGADTQVPVGLLTAERDPNLLFELTRGRLEPVQVTRPVRNVRLVARELPAYAPASHGLFEARLAAGQGWEQLRERLRARLGDDAVACLRYLADHRPERAWALEDTPGLALHAGPAPLRPGWLLPSPEPLPDGRWQSLSGPERIESGWWDGGDVRRDYFRLRLASGRQAWAYKAVSDDSWWLQGWFG
ncbi:Y-family DNA polymerase [Pseudomonas japonica]|uniref:Y-family DNA polymerase n=1 Tax=Pseudomonas japonica TaxID=256466 RepID=UPI0015E34898|nr:DNA polymerase Y family protein [Pseudomonas japonica]MBA1288687.1 DNA polymerase Y family protein [Pseudomonas japonica]